MGKTLIEWTDKSWNPITGCSPVSEGCRNCYAKRMANRLKGRYGYPKDEPFRVTFHPDRLDEPLHWKKPSRIFVCSMGDLFHEEVPDNFISAVLEIPSCVESEKHDFFVLTKRPQRIPRWLKSHNERFGTVRELDYKPKTILGNNLWLGVSVEDQKTADERIPILLQIPAAHLWVSVEPMLSEIDLSQYLPQMCPVHREIHLRGRNCIDKSKEGSFLDWVVCGGETGPKARPLHPDWLRSLRDQCQVAGVPFFFKSWGTSKCNCYLNLKQSERINHGRTGISYECPIHDWGQEKGHLLDGKEWREFPK